MEKEKEIRIWQYSGGKQNHVHTNIYEYKTKSPASKYKDSRFLYQN